MLPRVCCKLRAGISALPEDDAYDYPMLSLELLGEASPEERAVVTVRVTVAEVGDAFQASSGRSCRNLRCCTELGQRGVAAYIGRLWERSSVLTSGVEEVYRNLQRQNSG